MWTQSDSSVHNINFLKNIQVHSDAFNQAIRTDLSIFHNLNKAQKIIDILKKPTQEISELLNTLINNFNQKSSENLIDTENREFDIIGEERLLENMFNLIKQLKMLKIDRRKTIEDMREKVFLFLLKDTFRRYFCCTVIQ